MGKLSLGKSTGLHSAVYILVFFILKLGDVSLENDPELIPNKNLYRSEPVTLGADAMTNCSDSVDVLFTFRGATVSNTILTSSSSMNISWISLYNTG